MSCFHPLKGWKIGLNPSGKPNYKITSYDVQYLINDNGIWKECFSPLKSDILFPTVSDSIDIPCGHCVGCLLDRSRQWADRCMLEAQYHDKNCFITLTYDDDHLKKLQKAFTIDVDGVVHDVNKPLYSLSKRDFQLFMKNLRIKLSRLSEPVKIRFFGCGEYGSESFRPHFHAIIFGYDFSDDRIFYKKNFNGDNLYNSQFLQDAWDNKGYCVISDISWNTCAYVSRYCLKKRDNDISAFYELNNIDPEFTLMSRRPGIARQYYDDNKEKIYRTEEIFISDAKGSRKLRPPRYFDNLYDIDYPSDFERIKSHRREFAQMQKDLILEQTDLDYLDYLKSAEYNFHMKTKFLNERSHFDEASI